MFHKKSPTIYWLEFSAKCFSFSQSNLFKFNFTERPGHTFCVFWQVLVKLLQNSCMRRFCPFFITFITITILLTMISCDWSEYWALNSGGKLYLNNVSSCFRANHLKMLRIVPLLKDGTYVMWEGRKAIVKH